MKEVFKDVKAGIGLIKGILRSKIIKEDIYILDLLNVQQTLERCKETLMEQQLQIGFRDSQLKESNNIIWQLTDGSESSDCDNMHKCHYCNEKSWGEIEHKKDCIVLKAEIFYNK